MVIEIKENKMMITGYEFDYMKINPIINKVGITFNGSIYDHGTKSFLHIDSKKFPTSSANGAIGIVQEIKAEKVLLFIQATTNIHNACCRLNVTKSYIFSNQKRALSLLNAYMNEYYINNQNFYLCYKITKSIYTSRSIYSTLKNSHRPRFNFI